MSRSVSQDTEETQKRAEELIAENKAMQAGYDMVYEDIKRN